MPHREEPRLDPRVRLCMRIDVTPRWNDGQTVTMETVDVSASGAACRSPINLPLKTQVGVVLRLPPAPSEPARTIACEAVVVNNEEIGRSRDAWRVGLYFMLMKLEDREAVRRFIFRNLEIRRTG